MLPQASGSPTPNTAENFNTAFTDKFSANSNGYTTTNNFRKFIAASNVERVTSMQSADLQSDNDDDIVFSQYGGSSSAFDTKLLENIGRNNFNGPSNLGLSGGNNGTRNVQILRLVDYDNDGNLDLVWVSAQGNTRLTTFTFDNGSTFASGYSNLLTDVIDDASDLIVRDLDGDGDVELLIASTDPATGQTKIIIGGDNTNSGSDGDFSDIFDAVEIPITGIDNFSDFNMSDVDGDGDLDLVILTTDESSGTSTMVTYTFSDDLNDGSGTDAYTITETTTINEVSYEVVVVVDSSGDEVFINDTQNTDNLAQVAGVVNLVIDYAQGWNLIAQPGRQIEFSNFFQAVESANLPVFFELQNGNSFGLASPPREGVGYWVYYETDPAEITFSAKSNNISTVNITQGWNLIGSGSRKVSVQALYDLYPSVADDALNIFSYNAQSSSFLQLSNTGTPDSLLPGQGYYFEAPSALNDADINGRKIKLNNDQKVVQSEEINVPFYFGINQRYEQKLILNFSRDIPIPPSMTPKKSWLIGQESEKLYSTTESISYVHYESDTIENMSIRLDSIKQSGYLLVDGIYKVYPNYTIQLPYKELTGEISVEWVTDTEKDDNTIVNVELDHFSPLETALKANYPNPFNPTTTIPYSIAESQNVVITIYNMSGQKVWSKHTGNQSAGTYSIVWNAANMASGVYLVEMRTSKNIRQLQRMTLMK